MIRFSCIIPLLLLLSCSTKVDKNSVLRKIRFDDQIISSSDWGKETIKLHLFQAELKLGEIVKNKSADIKKFNRYEASSLIKGDQEIYLKGGNVVSILLEKGMIMKQGFQEGKRYDIFLIPMEDGSTGEMMSIHEFKNDTTIKVLNYYKKLTGIPSYSQDPLIEPGLISFKDDDYTLTAKQEIIINEFGKPKYIYWYSENEPYDPHAKPLEIYEYNDKGFLIKRTFGNDFECKYEYVNDLLIYENEKSISNRDKSGNPLDVIYYKIKYQYIPNNINWTKRIETDSIYSSEQPSIVKYLILEKK